MYDGATPSWGAPARDNTIKKGDSIKDMKRFIMITTISLAAIVGIGVFVIKFMLDMLKD
jgi:hypothetical protein